MNSIKCTASYMTVLNYYSMPIWFTSCEYEHSTASQALDLPTFPTGQQGK